MYPAIPPSSRFVYTTPIQHMYPAIPPSSRFVYTTPIQHMYPAIPPSSRFVYTTPIQHMYPAIPPSSRFVYTTPIQHMYPAIPPSSRFVRHSNPTYVPCSPSIQQVCTPLQSNICTLQSLHPASVYTTPVQHMYPAIPPSSRFVRHSNPTYVPCNPSIQQVCAPLQSNICTLQSLHPAGLCATPVQHMYPAIPPTSRFVRHSNPILCSPSIQQVCTPLQSNICTLQSLHPASVYTTPVQHMYAAIPPSSKCTPLQSNIIMYPAVPPTSRFCTTPV